MAVEYMDYALFKKRNKITKYSNNVVNNLTGWHGFVLIAGGERDYDFINKKYTETNLEYAKGWAEAKKIKSGLIVYYRTKDRWGLPYLQVMWRAKKSN